MKTSFSYTETVTRDKMLQVPQARDGRSTPGGGINLSGLSDEHADLIVQALQRADTLWLSESERLSAQQTVRQLRMAQYPDHTEIELHRSERELLRKLIEQGTFIQAIRLVRYCTGASLRRAKAYAEQARDAIQRDQWED